MATESKSTGSDGNNISKPQRQHPHRAASSDKN